MSFTAMKENVFNEIVEWIESRLTINPSVEDIARGVGYSRRSVYNIFHEYAGLPVGKYIRMRRMTLAAGKLRLTHQPISSIACSLHFDSHQTFSREFKKAFGRCPSQYRHSAYWDMSALYQKVGPQGDRLPVPWLCFLEEQTFSGYGFTYTLSLAEGICARKNVTRRKIAAEMPGGERDIYILSEFSPAADNLYKVTIGSFIGAPVSSRELPFREIRVAKRGLYLGMEFSGSWEDYVLLSNNVYMKHLPELGLYRREGYDIERFVQPQNVTSGNDLPYYTIQYFVPVAYL